MRRTAVALLATAVLAACSGSTPAAASSSPHLENPSPTSSACPLGNPIGVDITLNAGDNGRSLTAHLCAVISVRLYDSQGIQSSDDAVLAILPLPLPAPPPGGAYNWFQAKRTGSADLTSQPRESSAVRWTVHVAVLA
jgi:hypothetical protein